MIARGQAELGMALATAAFGVVAMAGAADYGLAWGVSGPEPGTFPFLMGLLVTGASLANAARALSGAERGAAPVLTAEQGRRVAGFALPIAGFVALSLMLGLYAGTALYMLATLRFQNGYGWARAGAIALGLPVFFYLLLEKGFQVPLLKGPLEALLGL